MGLILKFAYLLFLFLFLFYFVLAQRTCIFNMLRVINTGERLLRAANDFIFYHRYDILMLSLLSWSSLVGHVGQSFTSQNDYIYQTDLTNKQIKFVNY